MNEHDAVTFLFSIGNEVKRSFESPVILVTQKDYADFIFKSMIEMRSALIQNAAPQRVAEIVNNFHLEWLQAVEEIGNYRNNLKGIPREVFYRAIDFTTECINNRQKNFKQYLRPLESTMTEEEKYLMQADIDIIIDMSKIVNSALTQKQNAMRYQADLTEFYVRASDELEELMHWLDKLYDHLAIQFSKVLALHVPELPGDLNRTLQQIIDEVATASNSEAPNIAKDIKHKEKTMSKSTIYAAKVNEMEIRKLKDKIKILEDRISRLNKEKSSEVMALQHKTLYLQERLQSLENLKLYSKILQSRQTGACESYLILEDEGPHIFNHMLPNQERCRLVQELVMFWDTALSVSHDQKSMISIFNVANVKDVFSDDFGDFTVDMYGRKLYTEKGDSKLYQLNEKNELVAITEDEKNVYFYDECGRYYLNENRQRVYKAHASASEYLLHKDGLVKLGEEKNGIVYRYDSLGRYYVNNDGRTIYRENNSESEYENDGLGNLVRIRTEDPYYDLCIKEPTVLEETKYLKREVGAALKICLADVVMHTPPDPILYLASSLHKYRYNVEAQQKRINQDREITAMRELCTDEMEPTPKHYTVNAEEQLVVDNVANLETE